MLVILLLISQISCDWVEITQNHYKKESSSRITQLSTNKYYEEKPKDNGVYRNNSLIDKQWNKATIDRVFNVGNIRRVPEPSVKTPSIKLKPIENEYTKLPSDKTDGNQRHISTKHPQLTIYKPFYEISTKRSEVTHKEVITKASNTETVKQVQINNSNEKNNIKIPPHYPSNLRRIPVDDEKIITNKESDENKIYGDQNIKKDFGIISGNTPNQNDLYDKEYSIINFQRLPTTAQNLPVNNIEAKFNFIKTTPVSKTTTSDEKFDNNNMKYFQRIEKINKEEDLKESTVENDFKFTNISITNPKLHITGIDADRITKLNLPNLSNFKTFPPTDLKTNIPGRSRNNENIKEIIDKKEDIVDRFKEISNMTKGESMSAMWKLMKVVSDIIYKNTHRSFTSKIKYLEGLKETILTSIEEQFENVWPDDVEHRSRSSRLARSAQARGHVEFPSSESTLMTISFLTFAVFLIKLVLQVIHTYKNKTMMVTPAVVAAVGRAAAALRSQN